VGLEFREWPIISGGRLVDLKSIRSRHSVGIPASRQAGVRLGYFAALRLQNISLTNLQTFLIFAPSF
jgi:hypothetical protein